MTRQRAANRESSIAPYSSENSRQSKIERKDLRRRAAISGPLPNHNKSRLGLSPTHSDREKILWDFGYTLQLKSEVYIHLWFC